MKRRSFIAALAGLPLVGRLFAAETPTTELVEVADDIAPISSHVWQVTSSHVYHDDGTVTFHGARVAVLEPLTISRVRSLMWQSGTPHIQRTP